MIMKLAAGVAAVLSVLTLVPPPAEGQVRRPYPGPGLREKAAWKGRKLSEPVLQQATVIAGVPAYLSWNGSGPTAAAMALAYYDGTGYPWLLPGDAAAQTEAVDAAISSQENYDDYCLPLDAPPDLLADKSVLPESEQHDFNCLADFCLTSQSLFGNYYGQTRAADLGPGIQDYVALGGRYNAIIGTYTFSQVTWSTVRTEITSNRPMVFFVDTDGNAEADLYVTVVGFVTEGDVNYFGAYNTVDADVHWYEFQEEAAGVGWGIGNIFTVAVTYGVFPPSRLKLERLVNDFIFFKEYINRLTWEANPENHSRIVRYKVYRKITSEPAANVDLLAELDASVFLYDDRGLKQGIGYTYWVSAVDELGTESAPVVVRGPK
jgi:hypothetical protein